MTHKTHLVDEDESFRTICCGTLIADMAPQERVWTTKSELANCYGKRYDWVPVKDAAGKAMFLGLSCRPCGVLVTDPLQHDRLHKAWSMGAVVVGS